MLKKCWNTQIWYTELHMNLGRAKSNKSLIPVRAARARERGEYNQQICEVYIDGMKRLQPSATRHEDDAHSSRSKLLRKSSEADSTVSKAVENSALTKEQEGCPGMINSSC